jgi:DNA-binding MarR family transcriptional regulator
MRHGLRVSSSKTVAFLGVSGLVRRLFHQLKAAAERAYRYEPGFTLAHRAILESLSSGGQTSVPALARARLVARQHVQVLVNELLEWRLVETIANPAHKRSPLLRLTAAGKRRFESIRRAEDAFLQKLDLPLSEREMLRVGKGLEVLSEALSRAVTKPSSGE